MKFLIIILIIIKLINCCDISGPIIKCDENSKIIEFLLLDGSSDSINVTKTYNISNYQKKEYLKDQVLDGNRLAFVPEIYIDPIPTKGGDIPMKAYFLLNEYGDIKKLTTDISKSKSMLEIKSSNSSNWIDYTITLNSGCKSFHLVNLLTNEKIKTVKYQLPAYKSLKFTSDDDQDKKQIPSGSIVIEGSNFHIDKSCVSIKITSFTLNNNIITSPLNTSNGGGTGGDNVFLDFNRISFPLKDARDYVGQWNISITIGENTITLPSITNLPTIKANPETIPRNGGVITLMGDFLKSRTNQISIKVGNDKECKNIKYPNNGNKKLLTCEMPSGNGSDYPIVLTVDGVTCKDKVFFSYNQPTIKSVSILESSYVPPYKLQIDGYYFTCSNETQLLVKFYNSINQTSFKYSEPSIVNDSQLIVEIPNNAYPGILSMDVVSRTNISNVILRSNQFKTLKIEGNDNDENLNILWKPIITSVSNCPTTGGIITFKGSYLHTLYYTGTPISIVIKGTTNNGKNNIQCHNIKDGNGSSFTCNIDEGIGFGELKITFDGMEILNNLPFSYLPPTIESLKQVNDTIEIIGTNFGSNNKFVFINYLKKPQQILNADTSYFEILNPISLNHSFSIIQLPSPIPTISKSSFSIEIGGQIANYTDPISNKNEFQIHPIINSITSLTTAGGIITIGGYFLKNESSIKIGSIDCLKGTISTNFKETELKCKIPGKLSTIVIVKEFRDKYKDLTSGKNQIINFISPSSNINNDNNYIEALNPNNIKFSYDAPFINYTSTVSEDGGLVLITGSSFNNVVINVTIGDKICQNPYADSFYYLTCYIPPFEPIKEDNNTQIIKITIDGLSNSFPIFNYNFTKAINFEKKNDDSVSYYKWLIPVVIIGVLVIVLAVVYSAIMLKRHQRLKKIKEMMNPKIELPQQSQPQHLQLPPFINSIQSI